MSTSLAEQLKKLAVPQSAAVIRTKSRPSFMFNPKEAAEISRVSFHQLGVDGFAELKKKNPLFEQFETPLFDSASKDFERSIHDGEVNKRLDKTIKKFLILLSPYFPLTCAQKALEWLINRFSIQEYNKNDFFMFALPYHETNLFARALQLITINDNDQYSWLKSLQKAEKCLPKLTLFNHAASNPQFLKEMSSYVSTALKIHDQPHMLTLLFNLYTITFVGAIEYGSKIDDRHITSMLGILLKGLKSDIADFAAGSYIIVTKLLSKVTLSEQLLNKFVDSITKFNTQLLTADATYSLIILYQTQMQFKEMTKDALLNLCRCELLPDVLKGLLEENYVIMNFIEVLLKTAITYGFVEDDGEDCRNFIHRIMDKIILPDDVVVYFINTIIDVYAIQQSPPSTTDNEAWIRKLMSDIETQYPSVFDMEVNRILKVIPGNMQTKHQTAFQNLLVNSSNLLKNVESLQKLYHPAANIRKKSIQVLMKNYDNLNERQQKFLKDAIMDRLNEDNPDMVNEVLKHSRRFIAGFIGSDALKSILVRILAKCQREKSWLYVAKPALSILFAFADGSDIVSFVAVLPFLLPVDNDDIEITKFIVDSDYFKTCKVFEGLNLNFDDVEMLCNSIVDRLNKYEFDLTSVIDSLKSIDNEADILLRYMKCLLLCCCLPDNCSFDSSMIVLNIMMDLIRNTTLKLTKSNFMKEARDGKFSLNGFLQLIEKLTGKTQKSNLSEIDMNSNDTKTKFYLTIVKFLSTGCSEKKEKYSQCYLKCLNNILESSGMDLFDKIKFYTNVAIARNDFVDGSLQFRCVRNVFDLLQGGVEAKFVDFNENFIPYLLICLQNVDQVIRSVALDIVEVLLRIVERENNYVLFLKNIFEYKEEILLDETQISVAVNNIIESDETKYKKIIENFLKLITDDQIQFYARSGIGNLLIHCNNVEVYNKLSTLCLDVLKTDKIDNNSSSFIKNAIGKVEYFADKLKSGQEIVNFYSYCIKNEKSIDNSLPLPVAILSKVDRDIFEKFSNGIKSKILDDIIEIATWSQNSDILSSANKILKHIDLDSKLILGHLTKMRDVQSLKIDQTRRNRRTNIIPTVDILDTAEWKKGVTVLEFIQNKKKIRNSSVLLPVLFDNLKKCLDFDEQGNVEYPKQLLLSSILNSCQRMESNESLSENVFNVELIVQCIRASQNPQTHHDALLLLAHTANLIPDQVLHHMMAIFTFMGSSVLRHDDAYSFQIINKIIDTIIPILVESNKKETNRKDSLNENSKKESLNERNKIDNVNEKIVNVLRVFVDAILDVPEHRRINLYKNLLDKIDVNENLYLFELLVFESHVRHSSAEKQKPKDKQETKRLDISADLSRLFSPETVINNCTKLIKYLKSLPEEKDDIKDFNKLLIDLKHQTPKQYRHYKYVILTYISNLLSSKEFVITIAGLPENELVQLELVYKEFIINTLKYIQTLSKCVDKTNDTAKNHYWKVMLHHGYDMLDSVNSLLTPQMFLLVVRGLTTHSLLTIRRRALELLNSKLQHDLTYFQGCNEGELHAMIPCLINIIQEVDKNETITTEHEINIQTALLSLKLFVKILAKDSPSKFVHLLDFITTLIKSGKTTNNVLASTILCLAELCCELRAHAISHLNKYMPALLKQLKHNKHQELPDLLMLSTLTAIQKILENLPLFLSPYLEKLFYELSFVTSKWADSDNPKLQPFVTKLNKIKETIGANIPARVLIPAVDECYKKIIKTGTYKSVGPLMDILTEKLNNIQNNEVQANLNDLTSFFVNSLQFRTENLTSLEETNATEQHIINALVTLTLKLSESTFRPLYYKIYDWAVRSDARNERVITFYSFSAEVAHKLKGLFVLFAGQFLNNAANLLDSCNKIKRNGSYFDDEEKNMLLLENTLKTLHAVFLYDTHRFVSKERFDVLMQPLVDQLENDLGGDAIYKKRTNDFVIPAIVHFAIATRDDSLWKQMNYQILLKMRHTNVNTRLMSLKAVLEFSRKIGDEFLPLLPESIPFLAEMLEDEEEEVEKTAQKTIQEMEKVLGEPLQQYF